MNLSALPVELAEKDVQRIAEAVGLRIEKERFETYDPILKRLDYVTIDQVATMADVSRKTVYNWIDAGYLNEARKGCKERYLLSDVLKYIASRNDRKHKHAK